MADRLLLAACFLSASSLLARDAPTQAGLPALSPGRVAHGFRAVALYLDDADRPFGARFVHERTGFTLDWLQFQSAPQAHIYVNTPPVSDQGEPHTQEHLLIGKGNQGRALGTFEATALVTSNAYTLPWRTVYNFHTTATGLTVFYQVLGRELDALLHPDYDDEEVRREVRHFGVSPDADGALRLEEKGTVYNEMVGSDSQPWRLYRYLARTLYGEGHPLAFEAGGTPEGLRTLNAEDIRRFHARTYHLANMGAIVAVPPEEPLDDSLANLDPMLRRLEPEPRGLPALGPDTFPAPKPAPAGSLQIVEYPHENEQQPGPVVLAWPPARTLDPVDELLLNLFTDNLASDATSNLYKRLVDTTTRTLDTGATDVAAWYSRDQGHPVYVAIDGVAPAHLNEAGVARLRDEVRDELRRIAGWPDDSAELAAFNQRLRNRVTAARRRYRKFVNSPPMFGFRGVDMGWMEHLDDLNETEPFAKSVTLKPGLAALEALLARPGNLWRDRLAAWGLLDTVPYGLAARPSAAMLARESQERTARLDAEATRLQTHYGAADAQAALARYATDYQRETERLDALAAAVARSAFTDSPPMTQDDLLQWRGDTLAHGVPLVASTFETMTGASAGLALRVDGVPAEQLLYLALLPSLLTRVGVIEDGRPVDHETVAERLRQEVLSLGARFSYDEPTGRAELVLEGAGNDAEESRRAVAWLRTVLTAPWWTRDNLPRLRDLVDQSLAALRQRTQAYPEEWVDDVALAWRAQDRPWLLTVGSFLTRTHQALRLKWRLAEVADPAEREAVAAWLEQLAGVQASRDELHGLLAAVGGEEGATAPERLAATAQAFAALPEGGRAVAAEAAEDLALTLADLPDASLAADWPALVRELRADLLLDPDQALAELNALRESLLATGGARLYMVGSPAVQQALRPPLDALVAELRPAAALAGQRSERLPVTERLRQRDPAADGPVFVGFVFPSGQGAALLHHAPGVSVRDTDPASLERYLALNLYAGGGAHSLFMRTFGAGLAYSNGSNASARQGQVSYYADQVPDLPQLLRFVVQQVDPEQLDPRLSDYALALAFGARTADSYESRAAGMAADLADGYTPQAVRRFRTELLRLRDRPDLMRALAARVRDEYARVLPGLGRPLASVVGGRYLAIGTEEQLARHEAYLRETEGPSTRVFRLYPRDFWL